VKLQQANSYFNTVNLDGWDGAAWVSGVAAGNLLSFDRFITERTFGQKKRMFEMGGTTTIPDAYKVVRLPTGTKYIVEAVNPDIRNDVVYGRTYLLRECESEAQIIQFVKATSASGIGGDPTPTTLATVFCDVERITSENSSEFREVRFSSHVVTLPEDTVVNTDYQLLIDGFYYEIMEANKNLLTMSVRAVKLGAAA